MDFFKDAGLRLIKDFPAWTSVNGIEVFNNKNQMKLVPILNKGGSILLPTLPVPNRHRQNMTQPGRRRKPDE
jgi:hypothetical protein